MPPADQLPHVVCACRILLEGGAAAGVLTADGRVLRAKAVLVNADPFRLRELVGGDEAFPADFNAKLDGLRKDGTTMKARVMM